MKTQSVNQFDQIKICQAIKDNIDEVLEIQNENNLSFWSQADYENEINRKESIFKVAVSNNEKVKGFFVVHLLKGNDLINFESSEIINIAVRKSAQKSRVGQKLFDDIVKDLTELKIKEIWLEVRKSNIPAISFYQKNKFTKQAIRENYYKNPTEDAYVFRRLVNWVDSKEGSKCFIGYN